MTAKEREIGAISTLIKEINDNSQTTDDYKDIQAILLKHDIEIIQEVLAKVRELYNNAITTENNATTKQAIKRKQDGLNDSICIALGMAQQLNITARTIKREPERTTVNHLFKNIKYSKDWIQTSIHGATS